MGQFVIVECGGSALQTVPLSAKHWGVCLLIGVMSLPVGALIRIIPDELFFSQTSSIYHHSGSGSHRVSAVPPRDDDVDERLAWHAVPRQQEYPLYHIPITTSPSEKVGLK